MGRSRKGLAVRSPGPDGSSPGPSLPLFSYGSLLDEGFLADLLGHQVRSLPCRLDGFRAVELGGGVGWTVLLPHEDGVVEGRLYRCLDRSDFVRLDAYEGVGEGLYRRQEVTVRVGEQPTGSGEPAFVYLPTTRTLRRYGTG